MLQRYVRVFLLTDGRDDAGKLIERTHACSLLPAEGSVFVTNYRIIFKGQPCDPLGIIPFCLFKLSKSNNMFLILVLTNLVSTPKKSIFTFKGKA